MKSKNPLQYSEFYSCLNWVLEDSQVHPILPTTSREFVFLYTLPWWYHSLLNSNTSTMEMHSGAKIGDSSLNSLPSPISVELIEDYFYSLGVKCYINSKRYIKKDTELLSTKSSKDSMRLLLSLRTVSVARFVNPFRLDTWLLSIVNSHKIGKSSDDILSISRKRRPLSESSLISWG